METNKKSAPITQRPLIQSVRTPITHPAARKSAKAADHPVEADARPDSLLEEPERWDGMS